jgi:polyisoprenoid-binding protein YceI
MLVWKGRGIFFDGFTPVGVSHPLIRYHARSPVSFGARHGRWCGSQGIPQNKISPALNFLTIRRFPLAFIPLLAILWPARLPGQAPGSYRVDTKASHIQIHLFKGGLLSILGDDHLIDLANFTGTAQLAGDKPWWVHMLGEAASLTVLDPWASASDRREVADTMLGPDQLDVKHYPAIKLQSSSILPGQQEPHWRLLAEVTLHGVTRQVEFLLDCQETGDRLRVRGKKDLHLRDFNIQPISRALGAFRVKNRFEISYDITLERKP